MEAAMEDKRGTANIFEDIFLSHDLKQPDRAFLCLYAPARDVI